MNKIQRKINLLYNITVENAPKKKKVLIDNLIKEIVGYMNVQTNFINELMFENGRFFYETEELKTKFETICLLHGINDFPAYMNKNLDYLLKLLEIFKDNKKRKIPNERITIT